MIEIPIALAAAGWALLAALIVLVAVLYRQLAYLLKVQKPEMTSQLKVGQLAPDFDYARPGTEGSAGHLLGGTQESVLIFADPFCVSCERLLEEVALEDWASTDRPRLLIATDADATSLASSQAFSQLERFVVSVESAVPARLYQVPGTPYAFALSAMGEIRGHGTPQNQKELRDLIRRAVEAPVSLDDGHDRSIASFEVIQHSGGEQK